VEYLPDTQFISALTRMRGRIKWSMCNNPESKPPSGESALFEDMDEVFSLWPREKLREIGYKLHLAVLDKAVTEFNGERWGWQEKDVAPELKQIGAGFEPSIHAIEDTFFIWWDEPCDDDEEWGEGMTLADLKHQMEGALCWEKIDAMNRLANRKSCVE
jgi:hypothetical protein